MLYLADAAGPGNSIIAIVIGAIVSVVTAVAVPYFTLRSSSRATAQQQQAKVVEQANLQYDRLQRLCDEAERERDEAHRETDAYRRERDAALDELARLRHRVWSAGLDPDTIGREPPRDATR